MVIGRRYLTVLVALVVFSGGCKKADDDGPIVRKDRPLPVPIQRPPFLQKQIGDLEKDFATALEADEPRIVELQKERAWNEFSDPLIPKGELVNWKASQEEFREYRRRVVAEYEKKTSDPPAAREAALAFLNAYVEAAATQANLFKENAELSDKAVAAGSQDPIVLAYRARSRSGAGLIPRSEAVKEYLGLQKGWKDKEYPPQSVKFLVAAWIAGDAEHAGADVGRDESRWAAYQEAARLMAEEAGSIAPDVLLWFVKRSMGYNDDASDQRMEFTQACLSDPRIDPWIAHVVLGEYYQKAAWSARGSGFADSVSRDGWEKFQEYMPLAGKHYRRAWSLHPELAEAPAKLIGVAMAGGEETWTTAQWFHAAVSAQADYYDAYANYFWSLLPRWGGSHQKMADVAEQCIASDRWEAGVPAKAMIAVDKMEADLPPGRLMGENPHAVRVAKAYLESFIAAHEQGRVKPEDYGNHLARCTAMLVTAGQFELAKKAFAIGPADNGWWWGAWLGVPYRYSEGLTSAITGPARDEVEPLHSFLRRPSRRVATVEEVEEMQGRLKKAREADPDAVSKKFYDVAEKMLVQLAAYARGEWVDLTFEPGFELWMTRCSSTEIIDGKTLRIRGENNYGPLELRPITRFAPPFIVEAEVKPVQVASGQFFTGITIGAYQLVRPGQKPAPQSIVAGGGVFGHVGPRTARGEPGTIGFVSDTPPADGFHHVAFRRYRESTHYFAERGRLYADPQPEEPLSDFLMFGDTGQGNASAEVVYRNLRIRKLPDKPISPSFEGPGCVERYREALAWYPESPFEQLRLGYALAIHGQAKEGLDLLESSRKIAPKQRELLQAYGSALCANGRFKEAREAFEKDQQLFPELPWSPTHLAWLLATAPAEDDRDADLARRTFDSLEGLLGDEFQSWSCRLTGAAVFASQGDFETAKTYAAEAADAARSDYARAYVERVRKEIDAGKPYRMPATGEVPPQPANASPPREEPKTEDGADKPADAGV
jgi:tetratricopeptide (TPR) repeat protein